MTQKELIRQEIERLENMDYPCDTSEQATGFYNALDRLSAFIDSLPEEKPSEELEEELNKYIDDTFTVDDGVASIPREERHYYLEEDDMMAIARYFAEWGAKHLK